MQTVLQLARLLALSSKCTALLRWDVPLEPLLTASIKSCKVVAQTLDTIKHDIYRIFL